MRVKVFCVMYILGKNSLSFTVLTSRVHLIIHHKHIYFIKYGNPWQSLHKFDKKRYLQIKSLYKGSQHLAPHDILRHKYSLRCILFFAQLCPLHYTFQFAHAQVCLYLLEKKKKFAFLYISALSSLCTFCPRALSSSRYEKHLSVSSQTPL